MRSSKKDQALLLKTLTVRRILNVILNFSQGKEADMEKISSQVQVSALITGSAQGFSKNRGCQGRCDLMRESYPHIFTGLHLLEAVELPLTLSHMTCASVG